MEKIVIAHPIATSAKSVATISMNNNNKSNDENVVSSPTPINLHDTMLTSGNGATTMVSASSIDTDCSDSETNTGACCISTNDNVSSTHNNYSSSTSNVVVVAADVVDNIADDEVEPKFKSENNSVNEQTSLRSNFKKSNTCGSLFAKCACGNHNFYNPYNTIATTTPTSPKSITEFSFCEPVTSISQRAAENQLSSGGRKARRLFQSYSHPDATNIVFTDENKLPKCNNFASAACVSSKNSLSSIASVTRSSSRESYICTKTGKNFQFNIYF